MHQKVSCLKTYLGTHEPARSEETAKVREPSWCTFHSWLYLPTMGLIDEIYMHTSALFSLNHPGRLINRTSYLLFVFLWHAHHLIKDLLSLGHPIPLLFNY